MDVYWFDDGGGVRLPKACRLMYWDGAAFVTVTNADGLGLKLNQFNSTIFPGNHDGKTETGVRLRRQRFHRPA